MDSVKVMLGRRGRPIESAQQFAEDRKDKNALVIMSVIEIDYGIYSVHTLRRLTAR